MEQIEGFISTTECNKKTGILTRKIRELCNDGKIEFYKDKSGKLWINEKSLDLFLKNNSSIRQGAYGKIKPHHKKSYFLIHGYDYMYATTDDGKVVDFSTGEELSQRPNKEKGYIQVWLMKNGKRVPKSVHSLVVKTQGDNVLEKNEIHHIDKVKNNNKLSNLLPVWHDEHQQLHKLLEDGKTEEYKQMIKNIRKNNRQKLYRIPHLDFESNEHFNFWMWITAEGYKLYKADKDVPFWCIAKESAERKEDDES